MRLAVIVLFYALLGLACLGLEAAPAHAADAAQNSKHKTTQSESYVEIDPIYASILDGTKPRGLLLVELGLDIPDAKLRDRVNLAMPALRDAYIRSMVIYAATAVRPWRQPSVEDIGNRLQGITDHVMGSGGARVLLAQTAIRITR